MVSMPRCGCHGKPGEVVVGAVVAEIVEQQERVELAGVAEAEGATQLHAGPFHGRLGFDDPLYRPNRHAALMRFPMIMTVYVGSSRQIVETEGRPLGTGRDRAYARTLRASTRPITRWTPAAVLVPTCGRVSDRGTAPSPKYRPW